MPLALLGMAALSLTMTACGSSGASTSSTTTSSASSKSTSSTSSSAKSPSVIKIGTLYASSGAFAVSSLPEYAGLKFWASQVNAKGGVMVKALHKRIKVKIVAYNDQSSASTATNLYNQLISVNHVNLFVADFGSVLTSVAVPIAQEKKVVLFDQTGTGTTFFTPHNKYIVLTSLPTSGLWPDSLANYLVKQHVKRVAILYLTNDFDQSQRNTLVKILKAHGITPVYDHGIPTSTSNYTLLVHNIASAKPSTVVELGFPNNDIAFLQALKSSGIHFKRVFTIFPGQLPSLFVKNVGLKTLAGTYTYPAPPLYAHKASNYGLTLTQFEKAFKKSTGKNVNFLNVAGYNTGLIMQKTLETTTSLKQSALRKAAAAISGKITTLDGTFKINSEGAQVGETLPIGQIMAKNGKLSVKTLG